MIARIRRTGNGRRSFPRADGPGAEAPVEPPVAAAHRLHRRQHVVKVSGHTADPPEITRTRPADRKRCSAGRAKAAVPGKLGDWLAVVSADGRFARPVRRVGAHTCVITAVRPSPQWVGDGLSSQREWTTSRISVAVSLGVLPTPTPAFSRASFLAWAVPDEPDTIAPACPMVLPSGAVNPAT